MFKRKNIQLDGTSPPAKQHTGIRRSLVNSKPVISSGSRTLDRALGHGGVPLNTVMLIEEHGTTDFTSSLLKSLCSLSVDEARNKQDSKVIVANNPHFSRSLPKTTAKSRPSKPTGNEKMKIAWRYAKYANNVEIESASPFCMDYDFKSVLIPQPSPGEVLNVEFRNLIDEIKRVPKTTLLRVLVPNFLHPSLYTSSDPKLIYPFFTELKNAISNHGNAVAFIGLPLLLYPRTRSFTGGLELLCDTCIELEPFESTDDTQGFVHINKISYLSDRGEMVEQRNELSFKLGRYQFHVEPFAIPVEVEEEKEAW